MRCLLFQARRVIFFQKSFIFAHAYVDGLTYFVNLTDSHASAIPETSCAMVAYAYNSRQLRANQSSRALPIVRTNASYIPNTRNSCTPEPMCARLHSGRQLFMEVGRRILAMPQYQNWVTRIKEQEAAALAAATAPPPAPAQKKPTQRAQQTSTKKKKRNRKKKKK